MATAFKTAPVRDWLLVADGKANVLITPLDGAVVKVHATELTSLPAVDAAFHPATQIGPFAMSGISGLKVWIQSAGAVPVDTSVTAI